MPKRSFFPKRAAGTVSEQVQDCHGNIHIPLWVCIPWRTIRLLSGGLYINVAHLNDKVCFYFVYLHGKTRKWIIQRESIRQLWKGNYREQQEGTRFMGFNGICCR